MKEITIDVIVYDLVQKEKFPIFKRHKDGVVFKIVDDKLYFIVLSENSENIGKVIYDFNSLLNSYETIPYDSKRGLYHFQPCWYNNNEICFWSVKEKCPINIRDSRIVRYQLDGAFVSNLESGVYKNTIEPITQEQLKVMPFIFDTYKRLLEKIK